LKISRNVDPAVWFYGFVETAYVSGYKPQEILALMIAIGCGVYTDEPQGEFVLTIDAIPTKILMEKFDTLTFKSKNVKENANAIRAYYGFISLGLHTNLLDVSPSVYPSDPKLWRDSHRYKGSSDKNCLSIVKDTFSKQKSLDSVGSLASMRALMKQIVKVRGPDFYNNYLMTEAKDIYDYLESNKDLKVDRGTKIKSIRELKKNGQNGGQLMQTIDSNFNSLVLSAIQSSDMRTKISTKAAEYIDNIL